MVWRQQTSNAWWALILVESDEVIGTYTLTRVATFHYMNKWLENIMYGNMYQNNMYNGSQRHLVCLEMPLTWRK